MKKDKHYETAPDDFTADREYGFFWYSGLWNVLRPILIFICSCLLVYGIATTVTSKVYSHWFAPVDEKDQTEIKFVVEQGDSLTRVANKLEQQKLVRSRSVFKYYADFQGFSQKIQSGEYLLKRTMSLQQIAENLTVGDGKPLVRDITIIPGWTVEDTAAYLLKEKVISSTDVFLQKCRSGKDFSAYYYVADVLKSKSASDRKYALEGYLAPDTYEIYTTADEDELIQKLLSQTEAVFKEPLHARAEEIGMTMDDVINLASMIEKEAKKNDFAKVSAVFHNRLSKKMPLGSDVTIKYVLGTKRMVLTSQDLKVQSMYNTYQYKGLPAGPICSPSQDAVMAALYPDEQFIREGILYFCSKDPDTGELHFSKSLKEHEQAVRIYAPLWDAFDKRHNIQ